MSASSTTKPAGSVIRVSQKVVAPLIFGIAMLLAVVYWRDLRQEEHISDGTGDPSKEILLSWDRVILDKFLNNGHKTPARDDIVVLAIDDASLNVSSPVSAKQLAEIPTLQAMNHPYPWPRRVWAETVNRLADAGARLIYLDLVCKAPSPDPEDDRQFHEALVRHSHKVILGAQFAFSEIHGETATDLIYPISTITGKDVPDYGTFGMFNFWPDPDGIVRKARFQVTQSEAEALSTPGPQIVNPADPQIPSVALTMARRIDPVAAAKAGRIESPRFAELSSFQAFSIYQMFLPDLWQKTFHNGAVFKDKIVMVGSTAQELHDVQQTPLGSVDGVALIANVLNATLSTSFVHAAPVWWIWVSIIGGTMVAWLLVTFVKHPVIELALVWVLSALVIWGCFQAFEHYNVEASPLPASIALNLCGIVGIAGNFFVQLREKQKLHRYLGRYTSPQVAAEMMRDREGLFTTLKGVGRVLTIFFSDVRGFTAMSEKMEPEEMVLQLNEYLSRMVECVFVHRGSVDKFIGDAVMAIWGSERFQHTGDTLRQDALNAVTSALAMREALAKLNADWAVRNLKPFRFGMGIHQGDVVIGNIGSAGLYEKMDFTVIGDNVNLTSRLEGVTKEYGVDLIISEAIRAHVESAFVCRYAGLVQVPGKVMPVKVFTVIGPRSDQETPGLADYELAAQLYREGTLVDALAAYDRAAAAGLDDYLTHKYQDLCKHFIASPPEQWDGGINVTKK